MDGNHLVATHLRVSLMDEKVQGRMWGCMGSFLGLVRGLGGLGPKEKACYINGVISRLVKLKAL